MSTLVTVLRLVIRVTFPLLLILGVSFWNGQLLQLLPVHMGLGGLFVLALWGLGILGLIRKLSPGVALSLIPLGILVIAVGMGQLTLLPGPSHWVIRVVHLLIGVVAALLAERLGANLKSEHAVTAAGAIRS